MWPGPLLFLTIGNFSRNYPHPGQVAVIIGRGPTAMRNKQNQQQQVVIRLPTFKERAPRGRNTVGRSRMSGCKDQASCKLQVSIYCTLSLIDSYYSHIERQLHCLSPRSRIWGRASQFAYQPHQNDCVFSILSSISPSFIFALSREDLHLLLKPADPRLRVDNEAFPALRGIYTLSADSGLT